MGCYQQLFGNNRDSVNLPFPFLLNKAFNSGLDFCIIAVLLFCKLVWIDGMVTLYPHPNRCSRKYFEEVALKHRFTVSPRPRVLREISTLVENGRYC